MVVRAIHCTIAQLSALSKARLCPGLAQVHGRRNYQRVSLLILYCFYKNVAFVVSLMLYNFYAAFSGTTLYVSITFAAWNVAWTAYARMLPTRLFPGFSFCQLARSLPSVSSKGSPPRAQRSPCTNEAANACGACECTARLRCSFPLIWAGISDFDIASETALKYSAAYRPGIQARHLRLILSLSLLRVSLVRLHGLSCGPCAALVV